MRRRYTFDQLGKPPKPGIYASTDGTRVNLDPATYNKWKSHDFQEEIVAKMLHDPEHIGNVIYSVFLI